MKYTKINVTQTVQATSGGTSQNYVKYKDKQLYRQAKIPIKINS